MIKQRIYGALLIILVISTIITGILTIGQPVLIIPLFILFGIICYIDKLYKKEKNKNFMKL